MEAETRVPVVKTNPKYHPKINKLNFDKMCLIPIFYLNSL